ncbi:MAG: hypothetical protein HN691_01625 [Bacteroidetes bacterium]|nr:hypothetical protein [Bacteroidota bacterium]
MKKLLVISILLFLFSCQRKEVVSEVESVYPKFGTSLADLPDEYISTETMFAESQVFINLNESFDYEGFTAHDVIYGVKDSILTAIKIGLYRKDVDQIIDYFTNTYGRVSKKEENSILVYSWNKDSIHVYMTFDQNNGKGIYATIYSGEIKQAEDLIEIPLPVIEAN